MANIDFKLIEKEYTFYKKRLNEDTITKLKGGKGNPLAFFNSKIYRMVTRSMFKTLNSLEKGKNQQFYKYLNRSGGDYTKRTNDGSIYRQMESRVDFINDILKKSSNKNLRYSLLGIYLDIWDILNDKKYISAFKRVFSHVDKTGATNTIITAFKMIYISLVITLETIGLKLLSFEYDLHTGLSPEQSILNIMNAHSSLMKSMVIPMIKIIVICQNIKDPLSAVNELIKDENTVKDAKKRARDSSYPYKAEENGLTPIESFKIEQMDNGLTASKKRSSESITLAAIASFFTSLATTVGVGATLNPIFVGVVIFAAIILLLLISVPVARLVIYWVNVRKVDIQKELELQAELLNNNIIQLQEKLEKTSNKEERARLQNIINKQIEMLVKLQEDIKKYLDDEYEASVEAEKQAEDDDNASTNEGEDDDGNDDDFDVAI
jgi:hypothetical protein